VAHSWAALAYVYSGSGSISGSAARRGHALVLGPGGHITASASGGAGLRFLLLAGQPIGEPIVQHGPFVMTSQDEIRQALADYQSGRLQDPEDNPWEGDEHLDL
jgi:hypothetical protein